MGHKDQVMCSSLIMCQNGKWARACMDLFLNSVNRIIHFRLFEEMAVGVLNECYQRDKTMAHKLLVREVASWGHSTPFSIANAASHMDFMGHSSCQTRLNRIWKGRMALYTSTWKVKTLLTGFKHLFCVLRWARNATCLVVLLWNVQLDRKSMI